LPATWPIPSLEPVMNMRAMLMIVVSGGLRWVSRRCFES
jgi:hypothetical protein